MKNIKLLFIALASSLLTVSCLVDDEKAQLETDFASTSYVVGFLDNTSNTDFLTDGSTQVFKQPVDLIAAGVYGNTTPTDVTFSVDASSTAVAGTDYDFVNAGNSATIEANRELGTIDINVYTGNIDVDNPKILVLNLVSTSNGVIGSTYETVTITFSGICVSDVAGTFDIVSVRSDGDTRNFFGEVITEIGPGTYLTQSTGQFSAQPGGFDLMAPPNNASRNGFVFTENCGVVTIASQPLGDTFGGNPVSGTGTVDGSGNMVLNITVGNFDSFTVTYTRL